MRIPPADTAPPVRAHRSGPAAAGSRVLAALAFAAVGAVAATWAARIPDVQDRLQLSAGEVGLALLGLEGGALAGLPLGSVLARRCGVRAGAILGFAVYSPGLAVAVLAPSPGWLVVALAVWAAANSVLDVALNAHGIALERRAGRPLLGGLHAAQGLGLLVGAGVAGGAAATRVSLGLHAGVVGAVALAAGLVVSVRMGPGAGGHRAVQPRRRRRPARVLVLVGLAAFCAFLLDAAASNWVAVQLRTDHGVGPGAASSGFLVLTGAVIAGRMVGDRLVARFRRRRVVAAGGLLAAVGAAGVAVAPGPVAGMAAWTLVGLGTGPMAPVVLASAGDAATRGAGPAPPATAIATVSSIGYLGSFSGPPLIGALAGPLGLSTALLLMACAGLAAALLARHLPEPPGERSAR